MISAHTSVYGIIGHPVRHSFSPAIHNAGFQSLGIDAVYTAFDVTDAALAIAGARALGIRGLSVTIPHKEAVFSHLDEITPLAAMIGSVNTVVNQNGHLTGTNTDAAGFYRALAAVRGADGEVVTVFGSGGSARAVLFALYHFSRPARVYLAARNAAKAAELSAHIVEGLKKNSPDFDEKTLVCISIEDWKKLGLKNGIIVNTTPLGMQPDVASQVIEENDIPAGSVVMDIVYRPHETALLQAAQRKDCKVVFGVDMLLYQGMEQFRLWTGQEAPEQVMRQALQQAVYGRQA